MSLVVPVEGKPIERSNLEAIELESMFAKSRNCLYIVGLILLCGREILIIEPKLRRIEPKSGKIKPKFARIEPK